MAYGFPSQLLRKGEREIISARTLGAILKSLLYTHCTRKKHLLLSEKLLKPLNLWIQPLSHGEFFFSFKFLSRGLLGGLIPKKREIQAQNSRLWKQTLLALMIYYLLTICLCWPFLEIFLYTTAPPSPAIVFKLFLIESIEKKSKSCDPPRLFLGQTDVFLFNIIIHLRSPLSKLPSSMIYRLSSFLFFFF